MVESWHNSLWKLIIIGGHAFSLFLEITTSVGGVVYERLQRVLDVLHKEIKTLLQILTYVSYINCILEHIILR